MPTWWPLLDIPKAIADADRALADLAYYIDTLHGESDGQYPPPAEAAELLANAAAIRELLTLVVLAVCSLGGRYQDRVFYAQRWTDPDGRVFGKTAPRCCTLSTFRRMAQGYGYPYSLPGQPSIWAQQQAAYEKSLAASYAQEDQRYVSGTHDLCGVSVAAGARAATLF